MSRRLAPCPLFMSPTDHRHDTALSFYEADRFTDRRSFKSSSYRRNYMVRNISLNKRPCCANCHRPMIQTGARTRLSWGCKNCNAYTRQKSSGEFSRGTKRKREDVPARFCKRCGHKLWVGGLREKGGHNYRCGNCARLRTPQAKAADRRTRERLHPHCIECRRMMIKGRGRHGQLIFCCEGCNVKAMHRPTPRANPLAWCLRCRRQMCGRKSLACWKCGVTCMLSVSASTRRDGWQRGKVTRAENRMRRLTEKLDSLIPRYTPTEVREDAQQTIVSDVLARKIRSGDLTPRLVRGYVRASYGLTWNPAFISLDKPTRGSSTFGALLEG
jgi:hypothetical protein